MGSEVAEVEKESPNSHGEDQEEEQEEVTPPEEEKRGAKRESPEKKEEEEEEEGSRKRPARERKTVERYSAVSPRKLSASKALKIEEGSGTKLRDIPNVAFKLSKRKGDENLQVLHTILFGRKSNAHYLKRNILQFSGFVWTENKEKNKAKVKEKLDKHTKDKLIDFCELLDIHFPRTSTKKEDVSAKLLEFLESPHVTRDLILADKEKGQKRRRRTKASREATEDASSNKESKKHKKSTENENKKGRKQSSEVAEEDKDEDSDGSDDVKNTSSDEEDKNGLDESDDNKLEEEEEHPSEEPQLSIKESDKTEPEDAAEPKDKGRTSKINRASSVKSGKSPSKPVSKKAAQPAEDEPDVAVDKKNGSVKEQKKKSSKDATKEKAAAIKKEDKKKSSGMSDSVDSSNSGPSKPSKSKREDEKKSQKKEKALPGGKKTKKNKEAKPVPKVSTKEQGKGKKKAGPSTEELHSVVTSILKEVDFNTATLADILKQLGAHFNTDLMDRKAEVKNIIEEVINNMTDDEDDGDEDDENAKEESDGDGKE
ncbi:protein DEK-like isoform X2 [Asparagus officinalis]|uniref:protein DEK-like isoform X2 n=1 Tax=Asparagus officinalis TaxID=4686 RepID=UPI00098E2297|nr:protein DEK-like isoform X2 [Asparagus officinalis]